MTQRTIRDPYTGRTTTLGDLQRDQADRNYRRCVRCGNERPEPELFIGAACRDDPATRSEVRWVEEHATDPAQQRRALVLAGWHGGWWRT